ncbi:MAG: prephenate dehydratase [Bacillota bacterium]
MSERIKKVGYLGPIGTFSEVAAKVLFDKEEVNLFQFDTIPDCIQALEKEALDYTVLPIENSIGGPVTMTIDWLAHEVQIPIQGEVLLPIQQDLLVHPLNCGSNEEKGGNSPFTSIYSHPQALSQCAKYLRRHYPGVKICYTNSTAEAAHIVAANPDKPWLAIANVVAKEIYGLKTVEKGIQDYDSNCTRFVALGEHQLQLNNGKQKCSILISLPDDNLTVLHSVFSCFAYRGLELVYFETVPKKIHLGKYYVWCDFEFGVNQQGLDNLSKACNEAISIGCSLRHLGTYYRIQGAPFVNWDDIGAFYRENLKAI